MTKDEALRLALEALENASDIMDSWAQKRQDDAITAIKEALAQPEQEPVVWMYVNKSTHEVRFQKHMRDFVDHGAFSEVPLFSEPLANQLKTSGSPIAQRKPLSDDEIVLIVAECASSAHRHDDFSFARAIEAAHGIKGEA
jgi:hypothetical protein